MAKLFQWTDFLCLYRKFLIFNLISRNLKVRYRKSFFGMLWTILIPAGSAVVYYVIFSFVLKVNVENHLLFILCGLIPWTFFSSALMSGMESLVGNVNLLNKVPLPPSSLPLSETLTCALNLLLSLPVIIAMMVLTHTAPTWALLQYLPLLALLLIVTFAISLILGFLFVYIRDLRHLVTLVLQFWFYLTPIMYTSKMIPAKARMALYLNPVGLLFMGLSESVTAGRWLEPGEWGVIAAWSLGMLLVSKLLYDYLRSSIVEVL